MIITILWAILVIVTVTVCKHQINRLSGLLIVWSAVGGLAIGLTILSANIQVDKTIHENQMEYQALVKRMELVTSDSTDISKSDVIKDAAEWNKKVYNTKYYTDSLWTNWFHNQKIADSLEYIEME